MFEKLLTFKLKLYIIPKEIRRAECGCHLNLAKESEVVYMLEEILLQFLILSLFANAILTIISIILIIALVIVTYNKNHISAAK